MSNYSILLIVNEKVSKENGIFLPNGTLFLTESLLASHLAFNLQTNYNANLQIASLSKLEIEKTQVSKVLDNYDLIICSNERIRKLIPEYFNHNKKRFLCISSSEIDRDIGQFINSQKYIQIKNYSFNRAILRANYYKSIIRENFDFKAPKQIKNFGNKIIIALEKNNSDLIEENELFSWLERIIKKCDTYLKKLEVIIRPHPRELETNLDLIEELLNKNFADKKILLRNYTDLESELNDCRVFITNTSSAACVAFLKGIKVIATGDNSPLYGFVEREINSKTLKEENHSRINEFIAKISYSHFSISEIISGVASSYIDMPEKRNSQVLSDFLEGQHGGDTNVETNLYNFFQKEFNVKSILDLGCGMGANVVHARSKGFEVFGIDGTKVPDDDFFFKVDYRKGSSNLNRNFDLCWCVEFVEHIEEKYIHNFMEDILLCNYIILSAAPPGWRGTGHVNCRKESYWISLIEGYGYKFIPEITKQIRDLSILTYKGKIRPEHKQFVRLRGLFFSKENS